MGVSYKKTQKDIEQLTGWDNKTFLKKYKIFVNRLRNYERLTGAKQKQNATTAFYYIQKDLMSEKELTARQKRILETSSASTTYKFSVGYTERVAEKQVKTFFSKFAYGNPDTGARGYTVAKNIIESNNLSWSEKLTKLEEYKKGLLSAKAIKEDANGIYEGSDSFEYGDNYEPTIAGFEQYQ